VKRRGNLIKQAPNSKLQILNKLQIQMFKITNWIPAFAGMTINIVVLKPVP